MNEKVNDATTQDSPPRLGAILIQKHAYKDETVPELAKGLLVGLLTAIPAPLSSFGIRPLAAFGAIRSMSSKQNTTSLT